MVGQKRALFHDLWLGRDPKEARIQGASGGESRATLSKIGPESAFWPELPSTSICVTLIQLCSRFPV